MAFMSPQEIKAVRMKGSKVVKLEALGKEVRVIQLASAAQMKSSELNEEIRAGRKKTSDSFLFLLEHGCTDLDGNPLTAEDARTIFELVPQADLLLLVKEISELIGGGVVVKVREGPPQELTPTEKKAEPAGVGLPVPPLSGFGLATPGVPHPVPHQRAAGGLAGLREPGAIWVPGGGPPSRAAGGRHSEHGRAQGALHPGGLPPRSQPGGPAE